MPRAEVQLRTGQSRFFEVTRISADEHKIQLLSGTTMEAEIVAVFPLDAVNFVAFDEYQLRPQGQGTPQQQPPQQQTQQPPQRRVL